MPRTVATAGTLVGVHLSDLRIFVEPQQGAGYEQQRRIAVHAEHLGFGAFFRSDHYLKMGSVSGLPGPTDAWITLGALARDTRRIRLGTLVTSATFRHPGPLAISVAQVDEMSHGRVELGLGAGWYAAEHEAYAIPFPPLGERFERLEEQLAIITGLWATAEGDTFSFSGRHHTVTSSPGLPKPVQAGGIPIVIGGRGPRRTPRLAAAYADEFNVPFADLAGFTEACDRVRAACDDRQRDPATMTFSAALVVCCGADEREIARRAAAIGREVDELRTNGLAGTPEEVADTVRAWVAAGADRLYLQVLDMNDLDHLDLIAHEVAPLLT
jgi:F420-dependent oxidoreductase-like protein